VSIYKADSDIVDMVKDLVGKHHPDLALVVDEIAVVMREKAGQRGGKAILGKSSKASPLFGVLGDTDYKFILEIGGDAWLELTTRQQNALLDHLLCSCRAEEDDKGTLKYSIAPPDVSFYWDELDRWGDWRPRPEGEGPDGPSPVEEIFGKKKDEDEDEDPLGTVP
jgi:Putative phage metallopeptidase